MLHSIARGRFGGANSKIRKKKNFYTKKFLKSKFSIKKFSNFFSKKTTFLAQKFFENFFFAKSIKYQNNVKKYPRWLYKRVWEQKFGPGSGSGRFREGQLYPLAQLAGNRLRR